MPSHCRNAMKPSTPAPPLHEQPLEAAEAADVQLLSNGQYHVVLSRSGSGYSQYQEWALTRWREDATRDPWGSFCCLRDRASSQAWSTTLQPTLQPADVQEASFPVGCATFRRSVQGIETTTDIGVSESDSVEVRSIRITNHSATARTLDSRATGPSCCCRCLTWPT